MMEQLIWHTEQRKVSELVPLERNPFGTISHKKRKRLQDKIERLGVFEIPTIDTNNELLTFNKRRHILVAIGREDEQIDVRVPNRQLSNEERKEIIITSNIHEGEWNSIILAEDFADINIEEVGIDLAELGIDIEEKEAAEDDFDFPNRVVTDIVPGDIFQIGDHRLMCGDSTISDNVNKLMGGRMFDLVITDPPYNVDYEGASGMKIMNDKMEGSKFYQFLYDFHVTFSLYTKPGGAWYVWHADSEGLNFRQAFKDSGLLLKQCLIWVKNSLVLGHQDYHWRHEPCLYGWKEGAAHYFTLERTRTTVIDDKIDFSKLKKEQLLQTVKDLTTSNYKNTILYHDKPLKNDIHPTMKPVKLIAELIQNSSKPGQIVGDGFLGSGTTMVASHQIDRKCYAMELDPSFVQVTIDRMRRLDPKIVITKNGNPI